MNSIYRDPLTLVIPAQLLEDKRLNFIDKALWAYLARLSGKSEEKSNEALAEVFDLAPKYVKHVKTKLARLGYLQRQTISKGSFRLVPVDPAAVAMEKIRRFLTVSRIFKDVSALDLLSLRPEAEKVLHAMEVLEWSYRDSRKTVEKPLHLLRRVLKTGAKEEHDFRSGWWERLVVAKEAAEEGKREAELSKKEDRKQRDAEAERQEELTRRFEALSEAKKEELRKRARERLAAEGISPTLAEVFVKRKAREIMMEEAA